MNTAANLPAVNVANLEMALDELAFCPHFSGHARQACELAGRQLRQTRELLHSDDADAAAVLATLRTLYGIRKGG